MEIYYRTTQLNWVLRRIKGAEIPGKNIDLILKFDRHLRVLGRKESTRYGYLYFLWKFAELVRKRFDRISRGDIENVLEYVENNGYSEWTKNDFKISMNVFFKWLERPELTEWVPIANSNHCRKYSMPDQMLSREERREILKRCKNIFEKSLIGVLAESGCRIGELLPLRIKNVVFDRYGAMLFINGKTGGRPLRVIETARFLKRLILEHPKRTDPEAFVFMKRRYHGNHEYRPLNHKQVCTIFKRLGKGFNKKLHPHLFRHSRATQLANFLTEQQLKVYFGWAQHSRMASIYVHLSGRDIDNALLSAYGLKKIDHKESIRAF